MRDPEPHRCACCLRRLRPGNLWVCEPCIQIGKALGIELHSHVAPSDADAKKVWDRIRKVSNA